MSTPNGSSRADRAAGVLLGAACGDALGVPYEFAPRLGPEAVPGMLGGGLGPYAPGEYSDDTQMAVCVAQALARGGPADDPRVLDQIAENFLTWFHEGASDIGNQTANVLEAADPARGTGESAKAMLQASRDRAAAGMRSAGNGSLMRTGPVGLAALDDPEATARAARLVSDLTHADPLAGDACVLWCEGVRRAVVDGVFAGVRGGLDLLPAERRGRWRAWLTEAEERPPHAFAPNGFVVPALQAAWSAIVHATGHGTEHLRAALEGAVRAGDDTDTVAAIAGALLGARWGATAVPEQWRDLVHGWPGLTGPGLVELSRRVAEPGGPQV